MVIAGYRQYLLPLAHVYFPRCASGNKPGPGVMETAYIPHNHTWTVYYYTSPEIWLICASGNKPGLGAMVIAYIPNNHNLTV